MITEDYVSYEVAKLLKEKWFPINEFLQNKIGDYKGIPVSKITEEMIEEKMLSCIPQSIVMKWLREVHKLYIEISLFITLNNDIQYRSRVLDGRMQLKKNAAEKEYSTYEEACEATIKYCLTNLI